MDVDEDCAADDEPCDGTEDDEPSLGSADRLSNQLHAWRTRGWAGVDCELDRCDDEQSDEPEDGADDEPSLGSNELPSGAVSYLQSVSFCHIDVEAEHDGREPDLGWIAGGAIGGASDCEIDSPEVA
jgi:hypothetical protein